MEKKNIAIIIQKLCGGGAERTAANLSILLSRNYNVHLIVFDGRNIKYPYAGILHDLSLYPSKYKIGQVITLSRRVVAIKRIKRKYNITSSISFMNGANIVNILSNCGEKIITSVRIQMSVAMANKSCIIKKIRSIEMFLIAKKSNYIVALSQGVNDDLVENFGIDKNKVITIYNPCDGELLRKKAEIHFNDVDKMVEQSITTMGRLINQKGQWHLIRAFTRVVEIEPHAKLYILGEGPLEGYLKDLTYSLNLKNNVEFLGYVEAPHAFIMKSKVFVFPSLYEGLGNVLLEAMACGTPCIASDCYSGPREIIEPGTKVSGKLPGVLFGQYGILTSVGEKKEVAAQKPLSKDEYELAEAILKVLLDKKCREHYSEMSLIRSKDFLPKVIERQWHALLG